MTMIQLYAHRLTNSMLLKFRFVSKRLLRQLQKNLRGIVFLPHPTVDLYCLYNYIKIHENIIDMIIFVSY